MTIPEDEVFPPRLDGEGPYEEGSTVVVRIDNVAWVSFFEFCPFAQLMPQSGYYA